jgi:hypothetical protein
MRRTSLSDLQFTRYRRAPTFGEGTIRKFSNNASGMKKLAGRDFEDLLQVCNTNFTMPDPLTSKISARSLPLKDSFRRSMTRSS